MMIYMHTYREPGSEDIENRGEFTHDNHGEINGVNIRTRYEIIRYSAFDQGETFVCSGDIVRLLHKEEEVRYRASSSSCCRYRCCCCCCCSCSCSSCSTAAAPLPPVPAPCPCPCCCSSSASASASSSSRWAHLPGVHFNSIVLTARGRACRVSSHSGRPAGTSRTIVRSTSCRWIRAAARSPAGKDTAFSFASPLLSSLRQRLSLRILQQLAVADRADEHP